MAHMHEEAKPCGTRAIPIIWIYGQVIVVQEFEYDFPKYRWYMCLRPLVICRNVFLKHKIKQVEEPRCQQYVRKQYCKNAAKPKDNHNMFCAKAS